MSYEGRVMRSKDRQGSKESADTVQSAGDIGRSTVASGSSSTSSSVSVEQMMSLMHKMLDTT